MQFIVDGFFNQGWTWTVIFLGLMITISTSYQFGYNIGVLNQPVVVSFDLNNRFYCHT